MTRSNEDASDSSTLGAKIRHLIGVCGYRFGHQHVQDRRIAQYIGVDPSTWARMKSGILKTDVEKLGLLAEYFRLDADYGLTYETFLPPTLSEFKDLLKRHSVGAYGAGGLDVIRAKLMNARNVRTNGISIEKTVSSVRAGGLGGGPSTSDYPTLRSGESVTLRISHPAGGHLLVLSDGPDREIVCLMPSHLAPRTDARGRITRLPTDESPMPAFSVHGPSGRYRLYAVWTRNPIGLEFIRDAMAEHEKFLAVPAGGFRQLGSLIEGFDRPTKNRSDLIDYEIRIADYIVIDNASEPKAALRRS